MLELKNVTKDYKVGDNAVRVLKGISFTLRDSEFVSVLGPSGCGKTTMLNIIGGLDKYTSGDLIINGKSTKDYKDRDWDTYRSHTIGFVFQSYNLIPHQSVLKNVELALSISNFPRSERKRLAIEALEKVGLKDHVHKRPNQLSGGQCQRVSIARALVKNPDIILADEPTGALDSETSVQIMDLLKEISKERLVLMVTHNSSLAEKYSTRIVNMVDGNIISDTSPVTEEEYKELLAKAEERENALTPEEKKKAQKKSSMSVGSAMRLSFSNLLTKKGRTFITSLACSIGIIGIAVILSVSNGMKAYIADIQRDSAATNFIRISESATSINFNGNQVKDLTEFPENATGVYPYVPNSMISYRDQVLSADYVAYLEDHLVSENASDNLVLDIAYSSDVALNMITLNNGSYSVVGTSDWHQILDNRAYLETQYDTMAGSGLPTAYDEVVLVVDKYNRISTNVLDAIGISYTEDLAVIDYSTFLNKEFKLVPTADFYYPIENGDKLQYVTVANDSEKLKSAYDNGIKVKIVAVLREKPTAATSWISTGIGYTEALAKHVLSLNQGEEIPVIEYQKANPDYNVLTGKPFGNGRTNMTSNLKTLGAITTPSVITIYPKDFDSKDKIVAILDAWNESEIYKLYGNEKDAEDNFIADKYKVEYTDVSELVSSMLGSIINIITKVLIAFSVVSLIVSSIMIAIVTYASVIERIKEIGTIRSLGGRKRDVSAVFIAEASMIGAVSAVIALVATLFINLIINLILGAAVGVTTIAKLNASTAVEMIVLAIGLNLVASLIPARIAAKKDPVVALRTE